MPPRTIRALLVPRVMRLRLDRVMTLGALILQNDRLRPSLLLRAHQVRVVILFGSVGNLGYW